MIYLQSDFNPRTPCGVRRSNAGIHCCTYPISIHAPLAGCDPEMIRVTLQRLIFQSTHPLRGATSNFDRCRSLWIYFNPRTPCGVRRFATQQCCCETNRFQSTHPLRGATCLPRHSVLPPQFQSTHPLRGATMFRQAQQMAEGFQSTHPLRGATCRFLIVTSA